MEKKAKFLKNNIFVYIFCLFIAFFVLLITSKNSFLYTYNDWVDANAFFTMGKGMVNGLIPYKDLFEQKGLILYFIYSVGYLLSHKTFHGVFILEVLFFSVFLYYMFKIIKLFIKEKYCYFIIPILCLLITTNSAFVHGGSAEEFSLTFMAITLYYFFKHFNKEELNKKELIITGLCAGCVMMIKYTLLGFWIGFILTVIISYFKKKEYKKAIVNTTYFLIGMLLPVLICLIYMLINGGLKDLFEVYFYINMTAYTRDSSNLFNSLYTGFINLLMRNGFIVFILIILLPYFVTKINMSKENKVLLLVLFICTVFFLFYGLVFYSYYILPVFIFLIISLIGVCVIIDKYLNRKLINGLIVLIILLTPFIAYQNANYKNDIGRDKNEFVQYKYAEIINKEENPTLLNMGYLDMGLYTIADILPTTYFFELQNIPYEKFKDNIDSFSKYVDNKEVMFILYATTSKTDIVKEKFPMLFLNYELIEADIFYTEGTNYNMYLFKVRDNDV